MDLLTVQLRAQKFLNGVNAAEVGSDLSSYIEKIEGKLLY